jgi:hypothetical protein
MWIINVVPPERLGEARLLSDVAPGDLIGMYVSEYVVYISYIYMWTGNAMAK